MDLIEYHPMLRQDNATADLPVEQPTISHSLLSADRVIK
jgi:hypothetical protein